MTGLLGPPNATVVASAGRPHLLGEVAADLAAQTRTTRLIVSVPDARSLPAEGLDPSIALVHASGAAAQRNAGVRAAPEDALVFFFDDDAVVREDYIEHAAAIFRDNPDVVALTGRVLLDGATGEEVSRQAAEQALRDSRAHPPTGTLRPWAELYGCNFAYRRSAAPDEWFDERLPLYSWLEDHDFARRLLRYGRIVKADDCVIVHRGVRSGGRAAHTRLGYSQMINPLYLHRKGSFPLWLTAKEIVPRCGKNLLLAAAGRQRHWRRERLRGNLIALRDALHGHLEPERMLNH